MAINGARVHNTCVVELYLEGQARWRVKQWLDGKQSRTVHPRFISRWHKGILDPIQRIKQRPHCNKLHTPFHQLLPPGDNLFKVHCRRDCFVTSCVPSYGRRLFKLLSARKLYILPSMFFRISVFYLSYRRCWVSWKIYGDIGKIEESYRLWMLMRTWETDLYAKYYAKYRK